MIVQSQKYHLMIVFHTLSDHWQIFFRSTILIQYLYFVNNQQTLLQLSLSSQWKYHANCCTFLYDTKESFNKIFV